MNDCVWVATEALCRGWFDGSDATISFSNFVFHTERAEATARKVSRFVGDEGDWGGLRENKINPAH